MAIVTSEPDGWVSYPDSVFETFYRDDILEGYDLYYVREADNEKHLGTLYSTGDNPLSIATQILEYRDLPKTYNIYDALSALNNIYASLNGQDTLIKKISNRDKKKAKATKKSNKPKAKKYAPRHNLTDDQLRAIKADKRSGQAIADEYGIKKSLVYSIWRGNVGNKVTEHIERKKKITDQDRKDIMNDLRSLTKIAEEYNVSIAHIHRIKKGK